MRNLTKKALSLMLCLLLIVSALSGAFSIYAEEVVNDAPLNLDFSDGFARWKNTANVAVNNGTVTFTEGRAPWTYLQTEDFTIPNLEVGDTVAFSRVVTVIDPELAKTAAYTNIFRTNFMTSADDWANHFTEYQASITDKSGDAATGLFTNTTSGAVSSTALTVTDPEQSFRIQIAMANGPAGSVSIANMKLVVTKADGTSLIYTNSLTPFEGYYDGNIAGGTEADGYTTGEAGAVFKYPALSNPTNLDFSQGLKYWAPYYEKNTSATSASNYATVNDDGTLTLVRTTDETYKQGITSQKFAVSNVAEGDKIRFIFEYNFDDENGKIRDFLFRVHAFTTEEEKALGGTTSNKKELNCINNTNYTIKAPGELSDTGWKTYSSDITVTNADDLYTISLAYYGATTIEAGADCAVKFRNIRVVKVLSDGAYLDLATNEKISADFQPFGGTEEDGIVNKAWEGSYRAWGLNGGDKRIKDIFGTATNLVNGDFSQGFKYWFGGNYDANFPELLGLSDYATVENGIVKLDAVEADANGNKFNPMLLSQPFYIEGIKAGDILKVAVDARNAFTADGSSGIQLQLGELKDHSSSAQYYSTQAKATSNFFTAASETEWTTIYNNNTLTVTDPTHPFYVRITKHVTDAAEFKNIRIYKIDSTTGEITLVNNGYNADANYNKDGGSAEDGMMELGGTYVQNTTVVNKLTNLDFSQGLKYWAPMKGANGFTSDALNIEEDGSVTLTHSGNVGGIQTAPITFTEEYVGKKVSLWLYATHQGSVFEMSYYENGTRNGAYSRGYSGWFNITIPAVVAGAKYNFEIKMPGGGTVNLKDFRLLASVEHNNGVDSYVDLDGNEFMNYVFDFQPYGGTEVDGIIVPSNGTGFPTGTSWGQTRQHMPTNNNGLLNGNFSEGFKYWMYSAAESSASDYLTVDKETGVVTYNANCTTQYAGLFSQAFSLKDYVKKDDVIYVAADVSNAPSSMNLAFVSYYKDAEGNWSTLNTQNGGGSGPVAEGKWTTIYAKTTVRDVNEQFFVKVQKGYEDAQGSFKNVRILKGDKGALKKIVKVTNEETSEVTYELQDVLVRINLDGSLQDGQLYGDANNDGKVNLTDLVRMKKQAAGVNDLGIFLAAVDFDANEVIDGDDLVAAIAKVIELA